MAQNLREASVDLDYFQTSCLHRVINAYGTVLHAEVDEKVKLEMAMERRVYEELAPFSEYEKNVNKLKDKLNLVSTGEFKCSIFYSLYHFFQILKSRKKIWRRKTQ